MKESSQRSPAQVVNTIDPRAGVGGPLALVLRFSRTYFV